MQKRDRQPVRHHVEHRDTDVAPLTRAATGDQGFENCGMRRSAGRNVDNRDADARRALGPAGDRGKPRLRLHQQVIRLALRQRS